MEKVLSLEELKSFNNKVFYIIRNGKVVACKFTYLVVFLKCRFQAGQRENLYFSRDFGYVLELANGEKLYANNSYMPEIYETIDDCISRKNSLYGAWVDEREILSPCVSKWEQVFETYGGLWIQAFGYTRNEKTFEIRESKLSYMRYYVFENKLTNEYCRFFKTHEECAKNSPIEVVTF